MKVMKMTKVMIQEKSRRDFHSRKRKIFWLGIRNKGLLIIFISFLLALADILFIRHQKGAWASLTHADIGILTRINIQYSFQFWWDFLFGAAWVMFLYWMIRSRWFKDQTGPTMRIFFIALIIIGGLCFSVVYGGILYGLIMSIAFLLLLVAIIACLGLINFFWEISKIFFD